MRGRFAVCVAPVVIPVGRGKNKITAMIKLVIFDLDGTLLDTIGDLAAACDAALECNGLPGHPLVAYRQFVGNGILRLVERAVPEALRTPERVAAVRAAFIPYYTAHIDCLTRPYKGVPELLAELARREVALAVASNKYQEGTEKLIRRFFPGIRFIAVRGQRSGVPLKPDPDVVDEIRTLAGVRAAETLFVGDSGVDVETARRAGVRSVGVTWGFRPRSELVEAGAGRIADIPGEVLDALAGE